MNRAKQRCLCGFARQRQTDCSTIRIYPGSQNDCTNRIAVGESILERLQEDDRAAFATDIAIGSLVERKAAPASRQHRGARKTDKWIRREQQVDPADDRTGDPLAL